MQLGEDYRMHSNKPTEPAPFRPQSTEERQITPAEHRESRLHEKATEQMANDMAAALNRAINQDKMPNV